MRERERGGDVMKRLFPLLLVSLLLIGSLSIIIPENASATGGITHETTSTYYWWNWNPEPPYYDFDYYSATYNNYSSGIPSDDVRDYGFQFEYGHGGHYSPTYSSRNTYQNVYVASHWVGEPQAFFESDYVSDYHIDMLCYVQLYYNGGEDMEHIDLMGVIYDETSPGKNETWNYPGVNRVVTLIDSPDGGKIVRYTTTVSSEMVELQDLVGSKFVLEFRLMENPASADNPFIIATYFKAYLTSSIIDYMIPYFTFDRGFHENVIEGALANYAKYNYLEYRANGNLYFSVIPSGYLEVLGHDFNSMEYFKAKLRALVIQASDTWLTYPCYIFASRKRV